MRFRAGLIVGFGAGYYFGTMAGRERYDQIQDMVRKVKRSDAYDDVTDKAKAVVDLGVERAKDLVDTKTSDTAPADGMPGGGMKSSEPKMGDVLIEANGSGPTPHTEVYIDVPETDPPIRP